MYGQPLGTTMSEGRNMIYSRKKGKLMCIMALPLTESLCSPSTSSTDAVEGSCSARTSKCGHHTVRLGVKRRHYVTLHGSSRSPWSHWYHKLWLQFRGENMQHCMIVVIATNITCHALSIVYAKQPMGVATHTQWGTMHKIMEMNRQSTDLSRSLFTDSEVMFVDLKT